MTTPLSVPALAPASGLLPFCQKHGAVAIHPIDGSVYLYTATEYAEAAALWRTTPAGGYEVVATTTAGTLPAGIAAPRGVFWDADRERLVLAVVQENETILLALGPEPEVLESPFVGESRGGFAGLADRDAPIVYDPKRRRLLTFAPVDYGHGEWLVFELVDGRFEVCDARLPLGDVESYGGTPLAVWDRKREAVALVGMEATCLWDGREVRTLAVPTKPDGVVFGDRAECGGFTDPETGRVVAYRKGNAFRLGDDDWEPLEGTELPKRPGFAGACPKSGRVLFFGGEVERPIQLVLSELVDGRFVAGADAICPGSRAAVADDATAVTYGFAGATLRRDGVMQRVDGDVWVSAGDRLVGASVEGRLFEVRGGEHREIAGPADGMTLRARGMMQLGWDASRGHAVIVGGADEDKRKALRETWIHDGSAWALREPKGGSPRTEYGLLCSHPSLGLVLAGAYLDWYKKPDPKWWRWDGARWHGAPAAYAGPDRSARLLFHDAPSGQTILGLAQDDRLVLWRLDGEDWSEVGGLPLADGQAHAFDPSRRALVVIGPAPDGSFGSGRFEADLGPWLDALPAPTVVERDEAKQAPEKTKKKKAKTTKEASESADEKAEGPTERYLALSDDRSDKYWFAWLRDRTVEVRYGRRGTTGQTKTFRHKSADAARADFAKKVDDKLRKGYEDAPSGAAAADFAGRKVWYGKAARSGPDQLGGAAPGVSADAWPVCSDCDAPMGHVATLRADPERLPLSKHAGVAIFMCMSGSCDETWDASAGQNAALLLTDAKKAGKAPKGAPGLKKRAIAWKEGFEKDPEVEPDAEIPITTKVGGYPGWIQSEESVTCPQCEAAMTLRAQLDGSLDHDLNFGDTGTAFVLVCPDEHAAAFLWQCY